jgi:hypothetical protein
MTESMAESMTEDCIDESRWWVAGLTPKSSIQPSMQPFAIRHLSSAIDSAIRTLTR